jgi:hypothetical protein
MFFLFDVHLHPKNLELLPSPPRPPPSAILNSTRTTHPITRIHQAARAAFFAKCALLAGIRIAALSFVVFLIQLSARDQEQW